MHLSLTPTSCPPLRCVIAFDECELTRDRQKALPTTSRACKHARTCCYYHRQQSSPAAVLRPAGAGVVGSNIVPQQQPAITPAPVPSPANVEADVTQPWRPQNTPATVTVPAAVVAGGSRAAARVLRRHYIWPRTKSPGTEVLTTLAATPEQQAVQMCTTQPFTAESTGSLTDTTQ